MWQQRSSSLMRLIGTCCPSNYCVHSTTQQMPASLLSIARSTILTTYFSEAGGQQKNNKVVSIINHYTKLESTTNTQSSPLHFHFGLRHCPWVIGMKVLERRTSTLFNVTSYSEMIKTSSQQLFAKMVGCQNN